MFNSKRKILKNMIKNVCVNQSCVFKDAVQEVVVNFGVDEEPDKEILINVRRQYLKACCDAVTEVLKASSPVLYVRLQMAIETPGLVGMEDYDTSYGVSAGALFNICYMVLDNKSAKNADIVELNYFQNNVMNNILRAMDNEM